MTKSYYPHRRQVLAGAAALGAFVAVSPVLAARAETPIGALWARAQALKARMAPHEKAIQAAFANGGTPGWMRLRGEANALGEERYGLIVSILNETPRSRADLDIQAAAARDSDMIHGPRAWASAQAEKAKTAFDRAA